MARFISLVSFTDQGARAVKDSPSRAEGLIKMAESLGVKVLSVYWTLGAYDLVVTLEGNDEAVAAALLKLGAAGNVRSQTLRAFDAAEFSKIVKAMP